MKELKFRVWNKKKMEPFELNNSQIMQFTGFYDKNKKEIFEGDIILSPSGSIDVVEDLITFGWEIIEYLDWKTECLEIIGNIYENSELISKN